MPMPELRAAGLGLKLEYVAGTSHANLRWETLRAL